MQYHKLNGIIINRRSVGDADRFLTIFTQERGKISVYARSIRSLKSKRGSSLDLFSHIKFELVEKNDHRTLTSVDLLDGHHASKTDLSNISRLFQIGELVDVLTGEDDPHPELYDLLVTALTHLHRFSTPDYLYRFKKKLLDLLGYWNTALTASTIDDYIDTLLTRPLRAKIIL
jgi:DNA repair protein RecO (recombination protein O)